ncbi:hypothetical protein XENOCAPTIV_003343 [Xenoophorus captivus]|uniref:Uncharacterized protein n=1 Tax=Xenoophorus captivus TaxID=1517983 RepID=A0ABV0QUR0_9TELE
MMAAVCSPSASCPHLIEGDSRRAAHQLGPPGSLLPRRQVLPPPRAAEETFRHPPHTAAQAYSVKEPLWGDGRMEVMVGLQGEEEDDSWVGFKKTVCELDQLKVRLLEMDV